MPNYRAIARQDALAYGLDPNIFLRQINQESGFNPNAHSDAGADGIAQFMPFWHVPHDPVVQLRKAASVMASYVKKYGSYARALSAYNSGKADAYLDPQFAHGQTYNYVKDILGGKNIPVKTTAADAASGVIMPSSPFMTGAPATPQTGAADLLKLILARGQARRSGQTPPAFSTLLLQGLLQQPAVAPQPQVETPTQMPLSAPQMAPKATGGKGLVQVPGGYATRSGISLNSAVLGEALKVAKLFGVKINSGYRSPEHNAAVGGAPHSDHLSGNAVDFTGSSQAMAKLYQWAQGRFPYIEPMSQAKNHVHISFIR